MMSPRLPLKPASEAIVVVLITNTAAVRMPANTPGTESGSSTLKRTSRSLMPIPPCGIDEVRVDAVDRVVGVGHDRRYRQDHERQLDDGQAEPEERDADRQHDETRQRASEVPDVDRDEAAAMQVAED